MLFQFIFYNQNGKFGFKLIYLFIYSTALIHYFFQNDCWRNFSGCSCLVKIFNVCGYDNVHSLKCINDKHLNELEEYVNQNRQIIQSMDCEHSNVYGAQHKFQLLPGHRAYILRWCETQHQNQSHADDICKESLLNNPAFSTIMVEIIRSALNNYTKSPNARRFSEVLMNFCIYLYIMASKASYELISANLPIPKAKTIRKYL